MTYVVTENCIKCVYMDCIELCPVDCFHEGENMLVINPLGCIDCGICETQCPALAIASDTDEGLGQWLALNHEFSQQWPRITRKRAASEDAERYDGEQEKFLRYFSAHPGPGDGWEQN
jgi:ferredoxin